MLNNTKFYLVGEHSPLITTHSIRNKSIYDVLAPEIIWLLNEEKVSEFEAMDRIKVVELTTADEEDNVEAVYLDDKLIGSLEYPFIYPVDQYITYEQFNKL